MKRIPALPLVLCALLFGVAPASAGPQRDASGEWTYLPTLVSVKQAGHNLSSCATDAGTWTGTFTGESTEDFVVACHPNAGFLASTRAPSTPPAPWMDAKAR